MTPVLSGGLALALRAGQVGSHVPPRSEALSKAGDYGHDPGRVAERMIADGFIGGALVIVPVDEPMAREMARLRRVTRACLALGSRLGLPVIAAGR